MTPLVAAIDAHIMTNPLSPRRRAIYDRLARLKSDVATARAELDTGHYFPPPFSVHLGPFPPPSPPCLQCGRQNQRSPVRQNPDFNRSASSSPSSSPLAALKQRIRHTGMLEKLKSQQKQVPILQNVVRKHRTHQSVREQRAKLENESAQVLQHAIRGRLISRSQHRKRLEHESAQVLQHAIRGEAASQTVKGHDQEGPYKVRGALGQGSAQRQTMMCAASLSLDLTQTISDPNPNPRRNPLDLLSLTIHLPNHNSALYSSLHT